VIALTVGYFLYLLPRLRFARRLTLPALCVSLAPPLAPFSCLVIAPAAATFFVYCLGFASLAVLLALVSGQKIADQAQASLQLVF
jgi:hypothetical protein